LLKLCSNEKGSSSSDSQSSIMFELDIVNKAENIIHIGNDVI